MIPNNYMCDGQMSIFDFKRVPYKIRKPVRLIELFGGIGSQAMALERLGVDFEHYRLVEFDKYPVASYNAIHHTNFEPIDITKIKGVDLGITETEKYVYIMTYSFPCQDLSVAGKGKGMSKENQANEETRTRSGLLWEVERLLNEICELPQVLIMENVPQVHGKKNIDDFNKWLNFLESKGYSNTYQDLNSKNFGVAQSRNRCICVSILGNYSYQFPSEISLKKSMKDYLENSVDEKYYLKSDRAKELIDKLIEDGKILTDRQTDRPTDRQTDRPTDRQTIDLSLNEPGTTEIANCLLAHLYKDGYTIFNRKHEANGVCEIQKIENYQVTE